MTQQEEHLQAFYVRYGDALAAGDVPTVAECYTLPALVRNSPLRVRVLSPTPWVGSASSLASRLSATFRRL
jgi:hypothetical protein